MAVAPISGIPTLEATDPFAPVGKKELDRADFMTLFITQLQYQDPLKPMDSYEMASQLAQFSNMEATMKMSDNMEKMLDYQVSQNNIQLLTLIGTTVQVPGNQVVVREGEVGEAQFTLQEAADSAEVKIYDENDSLVRTIDIGVPQVNDYTLQWDGLTDKGDQAPDGAYRYVVNAFDVEGQQVEVDYRMTGKVTGVDFNSGQALLTLDDYIDVDVSEVSRVM